MQLPLEIERRRLFCDITDCCGLYLFLVNYKFCVVSAEIQNGTRLHAA